MCVLLRVGFILMCLLSAPSFGIECYRCNSTNHRECLEKFIHPSSLKPESCSDVFEAKYCVKTTGYYKGEIGDQRFCSARDLGNSCEYILSDDGGREYRSCVYTCSTDACNASNALSSFRLVTLLAAPCVLTLLTVLLQRL